MEIIIAGAGKVGFYLAKTLSTCHNITIIDKNSEAVAKIQEDLDVLAIHGDIENPKIYFKLAKKIDFFIAVTNFDETNIISSLIIDDILNVDKKIIRLRNSFFIKSRTLEKINIHEAIFTYFHSANNIRYLLEFPDANNVKYLNDSNMILLSLRIENREVVGFNIREVIKKFSDEVIIAGIERDKEFFIPNYTELIKSGDLIYIFGDKEIIKKNYSYFVKEEQNRKKLKNFIIFGANQLGIEIAKVLIEHKLNVKIIEKDLKKCETATEILQNNAIVLNSRYGWGHLLKEEGLNSADVLIASTENDEYNIIKCMEGKKSGISKVIAINNDREYYSLMHSLGIIVVRGEKISTYYSILESINSNNIIMQKRFCGGRGLLLSKRVIKESKIINQEIKIANKIKDLATLYIIRDNRIIKEFDNLTYQEGDTIILFSKIENNEKLNSWLYE